MRRARIAALLAFVEVAGCGARTGLFVDEPIDAASPDACAPSAPLAEIDGCRTDAPSASVRGSTPFGPVDELYAFAGFLDACGVTSVILAPESALRGVAGLPVARYPAISVHGIPGGAVGTFTVAVVVEDGCTRHEAEGTVVITRHDLPRDDPRGPLPPGGFCTCDPRVADCTDPVDAVIEGELTLDAPGFTVRGRFASTFCHAMHGVCF